MLGAVATGDGGVARTARARSGAECVGDLLSKSFSQIFNC